MTRPTMTSLVLVGPLADKRACGTLSSQANGRVVLAPVFPGAFPRNAEGRVLLPGALE